MKRRNRKQSGFALSEFAGVLVVGLPLLMLLIYVATELAQFYSIKSAMDLGARSVARALVVYYNVNNNTELNTTDSSFSSMPVNMPGYISGPSQFTVTWDSPTTPTIVTVTCAYPAGGGNGLIPFPWGPLRYLSRGATFSLADFSVKSTFTLPIQ